MRNQELVTTDDILHTLCDSVVGVLSAASKNDVRYSGMVQRIQKTGLKPDIGCFVLFDGAFSGLVVINFSAAAALELYQGFMRQMGIPEEEIATLHTSDDVANVLGELMNQMLGHFTGIISRELQTNINQSQPKMLAISQKVMVSLDTNLNEPQMRRVSFMTRNNNIFYLELAMDKTEFFKIKEADVVEEIDPDALIATYKEKAANTTAAHVPNDLLDELGL
ncbi:hypothetical protein VST7929_03186 [Vibrio stylophorae]|uniref:Chemotaxis protein CheX n=1 Tax=Vibrio stylophorae TaxID=659351 RepID=A0ABN8DYP9_9VIBR|nr:DUF3334 family protein [Vibrio stylophorae]CAH0535702.1 hypothetical protein VST7929_03186 [Vibrio stylophorae]